MAVTNWGDEAVEYKEVGVGEGAPGDSPRTRTDAKGTAVVRTYDVAYVDTNKAIRQFVGRTDPILDSTTGAVTGIKRFPPHGFPAISDPQGRKYVYGMRASVELRGWNAKSAGWSAFPSQRSGRILVPTFSRARLTIEYESVNYTTQADFSTSVSGTGANAPASQEFKRYTEKYLDIGGELITMPFGTFRWTDLVAGQESPCVSHGYSRLLPHGHPVYRWRCVPGIPPAADTFFGCVNDRTFDDFFPQETLLLTQVETIIVSPPWNFRVGLSSVAGGVPLWYDMVYHFKYDPNGHNKKLRGTGTAPNLEYKFNALDTDPTGQGKGNPPCPKVDMSYLFSFKVPPPITG